MRQTSYAAADSEDELAKHFETFKAYDVEDSGFIDTKNLSQIMAALEIPVTEEQVSLARARTLDGASWFGSGACAHGVLPAKARALAALDSSST